MPKLPPYFSSKFQRLFLLVTLLFIFAFAFRPDQDPFVYHCYAKTFWLGGASLVGEAQQHCHVFLTQVAPTPFHTIPSEYPVFSLVIFSLPLLVPFFPYHLVFACLVLIAVLWLFFFSKQQMSPAATTILLASLLITSATVGGRYDIFPAILTMLALVAAEKKHFSKAYFWLLAGTLLKLYPLIILLPLFLAEQQTYKTPLWEWKRYKKITLFALCFGLSLLFAAMLSPQSGLHFLQNLFFRPAQVESVGASLLWMSASVGQVPVSIVFAYGSLALITKQTIIMSLINGGLFCLAGILTIISIKQFLKKKITLTQTALTLLLVFLATGKALSPQYFMWLIPLVVISKHFKLPWIGLWIGLLLITALLHPWMYPFIVANMHRPTIILEEHLFFFVAMLRNILLFTAIGYWLTKKK